MVHEEGQGALHEKGVPHGLPGHTLEGSKMLQKSLEPNPLFHITSQRQFLGQTPNGSTEPCEAWE